MSQLVAAMLGVNAHINHDLSLALVSTWLETGPPDLVVVPATTLAALRRDGWPVPPEIDRLAGAVSVSRMAA